MDKVETLALQVAKEIVVKFVDTGRISPANFSEHFGHIYGTVLHVIRQEPPEPSPAAPDETARD